MSTLDHVAVAPVLAVDAQEALPIADLSGHGFVGRLGAAHACGHRCRWFGTAGRAESTARHHEASGARGIRRRLLTGDVDKLARRVTAPDHLGHSAHPPNRPGSGA